MSILFSDSLTSNLFISQIQNDKIDTPCDLVVLSRLHMRSAVTSLTDVTTADPEKPEPLQIMT